MERCAGAFLYYAGKAYTLLEILPFTDGQSYFKLKENITGRVIFLYCVE